MRKNYYNKIVSRLENMRRKYPVGYNQLMLCPFVAPPNYALENKTSEWWFSDLARDCYENLNEKNWYL